MTYTASDIQILEGLDAVRKRPGMYIGSTESRGLHHLLWEIADNAIDEAANGFATKMDVTLNEDGSICIEDDGRGIPVGIHPELKVSGVEVVFTQLHAGGKFNNDTYAFSGGLHGVGASVVNALSSWLKVEVHQGGKIYIQEFASKEVDGKFRAGHPLYPLKEVGSTTKRGSKITWLPDPEVFDETNIHYEKVARRLQELSFLVSNLTITLVDKRGEKEKKHVYKAAGGISDFVEYLNRDKSKINEPPIMIGGEASGMKVSVALQYVESNEENIYSYVNNIPTRDGGTHETGFKTALTKVMNEYMKNASKEKVNFEGEDYREGICAIISLKMANVQFEGQTKTRLGNQEARYAVESVVAEQLSLFFADLNNSAVCSQIAAKAISAAKVREAAKRAKKIAREQNKTAPLTGKLSACTGRTPEKNELFIVEGDSAGGSAKMGRDRKFQSVLPLRGKPLNVEKKKIEQVLANEEYRSIITALGCGFGATFNYEKLKYHKIIILSDADQDGAHIRTILLTFFFRYYRELVAKGHIYIAKPPLYGVSKGKNILYAHNDKQLERAKKELGRGCDVQRYKGLGEMNKDRLWHTTLNPDNRVLIQVELEDMAQAGNIVSTLMGDSVEPRRIYIGEYANFNKKDNFKVAHTQRRSEEIV